MTASTATSKSTARKPLVGTKFGVVVSDKRQKTRKVRVDYMTKHPKYGKFIRRQTTFQVHDEQNLSKDGDQVEIAPCRPMSKTKSWRLVRVVQAAVAKEAVAL